MFLNKPRPKNHPLGVKLAKNPQSKNSLTMQNRAIFTNWKQTYFFNHVKLSNIKKLEADIL